MMLLVLIVIFKILFLLVKFLYELLKMISLQAFNNKKKYSGFKLAKNLVGFIKNFTKYNNSTANLIKSLNKITNIPYEILERKLHQELYRSFNFQITKFNNQKVYLFLIDTIKFYLMLSLNLIGHFLFYKKNRKKSFFSLLLANVYHQTDVDRYSKFINLTDSVCLLGSFKPNKKIKKESYYIYKPYLIGDSNLKLNIKFLLFILGFKLFYYSIINKTNFFNLFNLIIYDILRSSHIFTKISAKYFFSYKFYDTSPIFNFFFKNNGGKIISHYQKNLLNPGLSCFVFCDLLFSIGKNQGKICNKLGGKIKKVLPVGSLFMESKWFNKKKDLKKIPKSDIVILGINTLKIKLHHIDLSYDTNYYYHYLTWLKKLSLDFPEKKIIIKQHSSYEIDPRESKILKDSNIKVVIDDLSINSSYAYWHKSKVILSFASTMIIESLGHGKEAYFIDPGFKGSIWFEDITGKAKNYRISSYRLLKNIILKKKINKSFDRKNLDIYCLKSNKTSNRILKYLSQYDFSNKLL